jgi:acylphosphatase
MSAPQPVCAVIVVSGLVQGVGYRAFAEREACGLGLAGWVRNLADGRVEAEVEGERSLVEPFIERLRIGPRFAKVEGLHVEWKAAAGLHTEFHIRY